jgi:ATP-dependent RNA helicase SUPV3L1/SUV3
MVESHFVGRLKGFCFTLDAAAEGIHEKATRQAATQVVARELGMRARRVAAAQNDAFKLTRKGIIQWRDDDIAKLEAADDPLQPGLSLIADEHLNEADREKVTARLKTWVKDLISEKLKPLVEMSNSGELHGLARGVAFRLKENFGVLKRENVSEEINALDQAARAELRKYGLRFGAFNIFFPVMLKPASAELAATLWLLKHGTPASAEAEGGEPQLPRPGLTSAPVNPTTPEDLYRANGFHVCGPRAIRLDILERLADLIRPLLAWRSSPDRPDAPPKGSTGDGGFRATDDMMSILGCSAGELSQVLKALGFRLERRPVSSTPAPTAPVSTPVPESGEFTAEQAGDAAPVADVAAVDASQAPGEVADATNASSDATPAEGADVLQAAAGEGTEPSATDRVAKADTADGSEASPPVGEQDVQFEEIWRPRRHQRVERGERHAHRPQQGKPRGRRDDRHSTGQKSVTASAGGQNAGSESASAGTAEHAPQNAPDRERSRFDKREGRDQRSSHGAHGGKRREFDRRDRDGGRRDQGRRAPEIVVSSPPKRAGIDPDSPFAALAALKASMDKRDEESGSR